MLRCAELRCLKRSKTEQRSQPWSAFGNVSGVSVCDAAGDLYCFEVAARPGVALGPVCYVVMGAGRHVPSTAGQFATPPQAFGGDDSFCTSARQLVLSTRIARTRRHGEIHSDFGLSRLRHTGRISSLGSATRDAACNLGGGRRRATERTSSSAGPLPRRRPPSCRHR
eukprot:7200316-Prymnesium_polylepis.1